MRYMLYEYLIEEIYDNLQYNEIVYFVGFFSRKKKIELSYVAIDLIAASLYVSIVRISQGYRREVKIGSREKSLYKWMAKETQIIGLARDYLTTDISMQVIGDIFGGKLLELMELLGFTSKKLVLDNNKLVSFITDYSENKYHSKIHLKKKELQLLKGICDFSDFMVSSFIYSPHQLYWEWVANATDKNLFNELLVSHGMDSELTTNEKKIEFFFNLNNMLHFENLEKSVEHTKVLMVSRYPTFYQNRIETAINDRYHKFVNLTIYKDSLNKLDERILAKYDFVISEISFSFFSEKHVYFPEVLSEKFINNLDKLIFPR